ncbi:MAG TPA: PadR family transcriptional regulator [Nitrososphaerales archaeon]|nr:PadR family transcriptional regulator [Nitrososphaerales archaeon]
MWPFRFAMHGKRGLRMMVVSLLSASPKNGVEIMDGVEAMTRGWWRPSPGSVYPLLDKMSKEGTVKKRADGKYELTPKANVELEVSFGPRFRRPQTMDEMVTEMGSFVSYMEDVKGTSAKELEPHVDKLRELARRLSDLAG